MAEFTPVTDLADVHTLDGEDVVIGYRLGLVDAPEPGSWASRAVWHGWRNGRVDAGHAEKDPAQSLLAHRWTVAQGFAADPRYH